MLVMRKNVTFRFTSQDAVAVMNGKEVFEGKFHDLPLDVVEEIRSKAPGAYKYLRAEDSKTYDVLSVTGDMSAQLILSDLQPW